MQDLSGKLVVLVGKLETPRADLEARLSAAGAILGKDVTRKTGLVVHGADAATKMLKARGIGVPLVSEKELLEALGAAPAPTEPASVPAVSSPPAGQGFLTIDRARAVIERRATFRYVRDDGEGRAGWDLDVVSEDFDVSPRSVLFRRNASFRAEAAPIPLENVENLSDASVSLRRPFDEATGEPYFTLYVFEHGDLTDLRMTLGERRGNEYRLVVTARVPAGSGVDARRPPCAGG
jgi:hypothetical protein